MYLVVYLLAATAGHQRIPPLAEMGPMTCEEAFAFFVQAYRREYGAEREDAFKRFCSNYERLRQTVDAGKCPECVLSSIMDRDPRSLLHPPAKLADEARRLGGDVDCYRYVCYSRALQDGTIPRLNYSYGSIDLREAGMVTAAKDQ